MSLLRPRLLPLLLLAGVPACGGNSPPVLESLSDQKAFVNTELTLSIRASDPDGDALTYDFSPENPSIKARASLELGTSAAIFRWQPLASDIGMNLFDFSVSDGEATAVATITIDVSSSTEGSNAPVFIQPLGSGTTLNLEAQTCADVPVLVEDPDSPSVEITQAAPLISGAELTQDGSLSAKWKFCPTKEQVATDDRYTLVLSADDGENPSTLKNYLIVLRRSQQDDCPGDAPVVQHDVKDIDSLIDLPIVAEVSDDLGIKYEPLLYYSLEAPGNPPDLAMMTQLTMTLVDGDMQSGTWSADIPNPVASEPVGSSAQVYYLIAAQDNDDAEGTCDHLTQSPSTGVHQITVTNPGGSGGLGLCKTCTADVQCGAEGDNCLFIGGGYHCFKACTNDSACPSGYYCSLSEFTSINQNKARQCVPNDFQCQASAGTCDDDSYEENDTAATAATITNGTHSALVSCPSASGDDPDWYKLTVSTPSQVTVTLAGGNASDLDLLLAQNSGAAIKESATVSSTEMVTACLQPGTYKIRVNAYGASVAKNPYTLTLSQTAGCSGNMCVDDGSEDDDDIGEARDASVNPPLIAFTSTNNQICADDDDWYEVEMFAGETLYARAKFVQNSPDQDLDLYVYDDTSTNLTGCTEATPTVCDPNNGGSGTSNETLIWPITENGLYYVVVHGWNGSQNGYDICISYQEGACP